eukprot:COSAG01_NODE_6684_length_3545_cov_1.480267_2_plen_728_part_00
MHTTFCCGANATDTVRRRNELQAKFLSTGVGARLGVPASWRSFINHGAAAFGVTFPENIAQGSSWNPALVRRIAAANAAAARAIGLDMEWYVMNLWAGGRFGRIEEGFSEEPTLTSAFVEATTLGSHGGLLRADDYMPMDKVGAFWKHCCGYGAAAGGLNGAPAQITEHTAREIYLKPWRRARAAGARGVMPSHQTLLNVPCHANAWLLNGVLRSELDWPLAYILSDTADVARLEDFRVATDPADAAAKALVAGVDVAQVDPYFGPLKEALTRGLVNESHIDMAVARVLNHKFSAGLFDRPFVNESLAEQLLDSKELRNLAYQAAVEGTVLLINQHETLPLQHGLSVAVIGPNGACDVEPAAGKMCSAQRSMLGNYAEVVPPPSGVLTVYEAIRASGFASNVTQSRGAEIDSRSSPEGQLKDALATAATAHVVVAVIGDSEKSCGEGFDRDSLDPPGTQLDLLEGLVQLRKPLVVVMIGCRPMTFGAETGNALLANISSLLIAWRPGSEGGRAIVDLLYGAAEPSGRLAQSWLRSAGQAGSGASPWMQERRSDCQHTDGTTDGAERRHYALYTDSANPGQPLFYFGEGLSLARHHLTNLTAAMVQQPPSADRAVIVASVLVSESSGRTAPAVVQLYIQDPVGVTAHVRPWKRLAAFAKVVVPAGGTQMVTLPITVDDLAFPGDDMRMRVHKGNYTLSCAFISNGDASLTTVVEISKAWDVQSMLVRP